MGKAEIIAHQGDGLYQVELIKDTHHIENKIAVYDGRINTLTSEIIPLLEAEKTAAEGEKDDALEALNIAIENYIAAFNYNAWAAATAYNLDDVVLPVSGNGHRYICIVAGDSHATTEPTWPEVIGEQVIDNEVTWEHAGDIVTKDDVIKATKLYNEKFAAYKKTITALDTKNLELASLRKEKEYLEGALSFSPDIKFAQCVDGQTDLTGVVGTIEVPGELNKLKIQPGFSDGAAYDASRDGILSPIMAGTPASVFYNKAILPGWQKWLPTYRTGTITAFANRFDVIDFWHWYKYFYYRGAVVQLDDIKSSAQNLSINQSPSITADFEPFKDFDLDFTKVLWNEYFDTGNPWFLDNHCNWWFWDYYYPRHADQINLACLNYEIGDKVVVKFENQDWSQGKIIGFEGNSPLKENVYTIKVKLRRQGKELTPADMDWTYGEFGEKLYWGLDVSWNPTTWEYPEYGGRIKYDYNTGFWKIALNENWGGTQAWNVTPPWNGSPPFNNLWVPFEITVSLAPATPWPDYHHLVFYQPLFPGYIEMDHEDGGGIFGGGGSGSFANGIRLLQSKGHNLPLYGWTTWDDVFYYGHVVGGVSLYLPYSGNLIIRDSDGIWHY